MNRFKEQAMKIVFMVAACASVLAVFLICLFLFANGIPAIAKIGPLKFLLGTVWKPSNDKFGIFPMIIASIYVTGGAILVGVPIALFTSVFMARYCPKKIYRPLKSGIELMAGVPSIVYGFFGLVLMVPLIRNTFGGTGTSWLAASLLLGIMILPTIIGPTESALRSQRERKKDSDHADLILQRIPGTHPILIVRHKDIPAHKHHQVVHASAR